MKIATWFWLVAAVVWVYYAAADMRAGSIGYGLYGCFGAAYYNSMFVYSYFTREAA